MRLVPPTTTKRRLRHRYSFLFTSFPPCSDLVMAIDVLRAEEGRNRHGGAARPGPIPARGKTAIPITQIRLNFPARKFARRTKLRRCHHRSSIGLLTHIFITDYCHSLTIPGTRDRHRNLRVLALSSNLVSFD